MLEESVAKSCQRSGVTTTRSSRLATLHRRAAFVLAVAAVACGGAAPAQPSETQLYGLLLTATASMTRDLATSAPAVAATLTVKNASDTTGRIYWAECPSNGPLVVFAYANGSTTPKWNSTDAYRRVACFLVRYYADIAPGRTWQHTITMPVSDILADSLPAGRYRLTGSAKWLEPGFPQELSLGELELTR